MQKEKLVLLCVALCNAKTEESLANDKRISIEQEILDIVGRPEEGSQTTDTTGFKIRVDQKITRKIDAKAWALVKDKIPEELRPVSIVEEIKVENKGVKWLKEYEPGYYKLLCSAMEEKPSKISVKVEAL